MHTEVQSISSSSVSRRSRRILLPVVLLMTLFTATSRGVDNDASGWMSLGDDVINPTPEEKCAQECAISGIKAVDVVNCRSRCGATPSERGGGDRRPDGSNQHDSVADTGSKRRNRRRLRYHLTVLAARRGRSVAPEGGKKPSADSRGDELVKPPLSSTSAASTSFDARLTVELRATRVGALEAVVSWDWPPRSTGQVDDDDDRDGLQPTRQLAYTVHAARETCNVEDTMPHCADPDMYRSYTVRAAGSKANFTLTSLTYNSKYFVEVERDSTTSSRVTFLTPGCSVPVDQTFRRCRYIPSRLATSGPSLPLLRSAASTQSSTGRGGSATGGRGNINAVSTASGSVSLAINVSCTSYDSVQNSVAVVVVWSLPVVTSFPVAAAAAAAAVGKAKQLAANGGGLAWNSTVLVQYPTPDGPHLNTHVTSANHIILNLVADNVYEIAVKARNSSAEVIYQRRYVNISRDFAADACETSSAAFASPGKAEVSSSLMGGPTQAAPLTLALGALVVVVVSVVAWVVICRCRAAAERRRSNLDEKKNRSLTKSNSYKSSPSGSPCIRKDEQIQMTIHPQQDEWEIDAHDVILGAELGQGAFGLVMTGYYHGSQVAIKVLKGDAPPSHRDELLREINLMKQLGRHPNIVTLVGSCTVCDPIALIMEYMPYGNLQNFLQKCRVEGSLVRDPALGDCAVQYCPLDQLTGAGDATWTLTSGDMLSFARQIALAMEHLTGLKYVHRDLAARNVLVGADKVVKLCDFGLARLVTGGDQYCKLTNGRLPLKWMALESIRDRVFTAQSDVWSFGVLLWEIATLGASPYANIALVDLYRLLSNGYRLEQPRNCSAELYDIMSQCWYENPADRPLFSVIRQHLDTLLSHHRNYLDLDNLHAAAVAAAAAAYSNASASAERQQVPRAVASPSHTVNRVLTRPDDEDDDSDCSADDCDSQDAGDATGLLGLLGVGSAESSRLPSPSGNPPVIRGMQLQQVAPPCGAPP